MAFSICLSNSRTQQKLGELGNYLMMTTPWSALDSIKGSYTGWTATEFDRRYYDNFAINASYQVASTFASAVILVAAIEQSQSMDHVVLRDVLRNSSFQTMYRNVSFNENNQPEFMSYVQQVICMPHRIFI
jgi:ABC-type branched-subunit amino acid transport system substrate-binding protein